LESLGLLDFPNLERYLKLSRNDYEIAMEYAEQNTKLERTLTLINHALEYQPDNSIFLDTKGWILFIMGKHEEAMDFIQKSLDMNPNNKEALEHIETIQKS
jgi:tetratricopeptide (TPR) repeat protein